MSDMKVDRDIIDGSLVTKHEQDVTEVLKFTKEQRSEQTNCKAEMHHVARVPLTLIQKLINEGRIHKDAMQDPKEMQRALKIVSLEYPAFMCTNKNVIK